MKPEPGTCTATTRSRNIEKRTAKGSGATSKKKPAVPNTRHVASTGKKHFSSSSTQRDGVDSKDETEKAHKWQRTSISFRGHETDSTLEQVLNSLGIGQIKDLENIVAEDHMSEAQLEAFQTAFEQFATHPPGPIDIKGLSCLLDKLDMKVTSQQLERALCWADYDGDGQVSFQDFLSVMTDSQKFSRCLKGENADPSQASDVSDMLFYRALNKLLENRLIPSAATCEIVRYYVKKALRHMWRAAPQEDKHSHVITYYAKGAHLVGLQPKQLMKYIQPQAQGTSPYSQCPCLTVKPEAFIPRRFSRKPPSLRLYRIQSAKTWKTVEMEERIRELSVKREGMETEEMLTPVRIKVHLKVKNRDKLTYDDIQQIRLKAKEGVNSFLGALSQYKQRDAWNSWGSLRSSFGLRGQKRFLETFSTYSWSWSGCRNMLEVRDLRDHGPSFKIPQRASELICPSSHTHQNLPLHATPPLPSD